MISATGGLECKPVYALFRVCVLPHADRVRWWTGHGCAVAALPVRTRIGSRVWRHSRAPSRLHHRADAVATGTGA